MFESTQQHKLKLQLALWLFGIAVFYAAVCTPMTLTVTSDVLLSETVLPLLSDVLSLFCNYLFYWVAFAILLYAVCHYGLRACKPLLAIYGGAVLFRYIANQIAAYLVLGFPSVNDFFAGDFWYLLLNIALDLAMLAGVCFLIVRMHRRMDSAEAPILSHLPMSRLFDRENPVFCIAIAVAAIPAGVQLVTRVIYDIFYGLPTGLLDLLWMIVYYLSDFANVLIGYLVIALFLNRLFFYEEKARLEFDSSSVL